VVNPPRGSQFDTVDRRPLAKLDAQCDLPHVWESEPRVPFPTRSSHARLWHESSRGEAMQKDRSHPRTRLLAMVRGYPRLPCSLFHGRRRLSEEGSHICPRTPLKYFAELLFTALKMSCIHFHRQAVEEYDEDTKLCRLFFTSPKLRCAK
ncbi:hypothetical protein K523DRAFT_384438, partial [Schizophyllum commune Tattone D]